jgi:hypothetical protein
MNFAKGVFVEHAVFGQGKILELNHKSARVKFLKKYQGKFIRLVDTSHLRVDGFLSILSGYGTAPEPQKRTMLVAERAMRDLLIGHITKDHARARRGLRGLQTIGALACRGLFTPDTTAYQPEGRNIPIHDSHAHTNFLTELEIMDWMNKGGDVRYLGRRVRNKKVDEIRRRNAKKRKEQPMVALSEIHLNQLSPDCVPAKGKKKQGLSAREK